MYDVIELGGGEHPKYHPNLDAVYGDIQKDVRHGLPFDAESVKRIVSYDVLEHFTFEEALALLRECRRVLTEDGELEFIVPDMEEAIKANPEWCDHLRNVVYGTRRDRFDIHKMWWSKDLARYVLAKEGWVVTVEPSLHGGEQRQPKFRIFAVKRW